MAAQLKPAVQLAVVGKQHPFPIFTDEPRGSSEMSGFMLAIEWPRGLGKKAEAGLRMTITGMALRIVV
ncbi:hypothetical protein GCM10027066_21030 [Dyella jejuensis]